MSDEFSEKPNTPHHKVWGALRETLGKAGDVAGETARKGAKLGGQLAQNASQATQVYCWQNSAQTWRRLLRHFGRKPSSS